MQTKKYLGATALLLVLASPAFSQTINQNTFIIGEGSFFDRVEQDSSNTAFVTVPGPSAVSVAGQTANNQVNAVGPSAYVAVANGFSINQGAGGGFAYSGPTVGGAFGGSVSNLTISGEVDQFATNDISAISTSPAIANALAGGNQQASNTINVANIAPVVGAAGSLTQVVGDAYMVASNSMYAGVTNGNATVQGSNGLNALGQPNPGFQSAFGSLNTANVLMGAGMVAAPTSTPTVDLTLTQKLALDNDITAVNSAIANSSNSTSSILDPSVLNLAQSSVVGVNQIGFANATLTGGSPAITTVYASLANLSGSQNGVSPQGLDVTVGNTAVAFTGNPSSSTYNLFSGAGGNGVAVVAGVTQNAAVGINNVSGGSGVSIMLANAADPGGGFSQTVNGTQSIEGPNANVFDPIINGMAARTNIGSASITGTARTAASDPFTQSFSTQQNSIATGGALMGGATQSASGVGVNGVNGFGGGYVNAAIANANVGSATLANVSQNMNQTFNTVAAGGAIMLNLAQSANDMSLSNANVQIAAGSTNSTISGAVQLGSLGVNVALLGTVNAGSVVTQSASDVSLTTNNSLSASGFNGSVSGFQSASASTNVIK